ncbi:MAG TPA: carboxypeptidase regulatory-like domain-containing protein, partial [Rhodothermales bacterium]|nr:carboxypeptidase regulatory-like domain-containing protein [Rhodothermales bacterium]
MEDGIIAYGDDAYNTLIIDHQNGYKSYYLHLSAREVTPGQYVTKGTRICTTGEKGSLGSPHLHYEIRYNGIPVDPYGWQGNYPDPYTLSQNLYLWDETIGSNSKPIVSAFSATPNPSLVENPVEIRANYYDADGDKPSTMRVHYSYGDWSEKDWYQDMVLILGSESNGTYGATISGFSKGGEVVYKFEALDGKGGKADVLQGKFVVNSKPQVSNPVTTPNPGTTADTFTTTVNVKDAEGDATIMARIHYSFDGGITYPRFSNMSRQSGTNYDGIYSDTIDGITTIGTVLYKFEFIDLKGAKADITTGSFIVRAAEVSISGIVTDAMGNGLSGVAVRLSECQSKDLMTDLDGRYRFNNVPQNLSCRVEPSKNGYTFKPFSYRITSVNKDLIWNFSGVKTSYSWSGKVLKTDDSPLKDVLLSLSGCAIDTFKSLSDGSYRFDEIPIDGNVACIVTPLLQGFKFNPGSYSLIGNNEDQVEKNFTATKLFSISGFVKVNGYAKAGVNVSLTGCGNDLQVTDTDGFYKFSELIGGTTCTVTVSKVDLSFSPDKQVVTISNQDVVLADFIGTTLEKPTLSVTPAQQTV